MAIRNSVFDIGHVILRWDPRQIVCQCFGESELAAEHALALFSRNASWLALNRGEVTLDKFRRTCSRDHGLSEAEAERLIAELFASLTPVERTLALMERLAAAGYRLFALSDNGREIVAHLGANHGFWPLFEGAVISAELGALKPDLRICRALLETHGLDPAETLFFDDITANVHGAQAVGLHARVFLEARQVESELRALGAGLAAQAALG